MEAHARSSKAVVLGIVLGVLLGVALTVLIVATGTFKHAV